MQVLGQLVWADLGLPSAPPGFSRCGMQVHPAGSRDGGGAAASLPWAPAGPNPPGGAQAGWDALPICYVCLFAQPHRGLATPLG